MRLPRKLWFLLSLSLLVRIALILALGDVPLVGDEIDYDVLARQLVAGEGFGYGQGVEFTPTSYRAPGHPAWLAGIYALTGGSRQAARIGQSLLMTGVVFVFFLLGRALFDERVGWFAALLIALDPVLVAFGTWLWAEPLYQLLLGVTLLVLVRCRFLAQPGWALLAGALWGLATLTRESGLLLAVFFVGWLAWVGARSTARGRLQALALPALFTVGLIAVLAPWTWRNVRVHGQIVPVTTVSGLAIWLGNNPWDDWNAVFERYFVPETEVAREALARREGWAAIQAEGWRWLPGKIAANWPALLGPENFLLRQLRDGTYGPISGTAYALFYAGTLLFYVLVGSGGLLGAWFSVRGSDRGLLLLPALAVLLGHTVLHAHSRHRLPLLPLLALFAAYAWVYRRPVLARLRRRPPGWRGVGAWTSLLLFWLLAFPFKREIWRWFQALFSN